MTIGTNRSRLVALAAVLGGCMLGGCGSSGAGSGSTGSATSASTASTGSGTTAGGSSLKVTGTPKFASPSPSEPARVGTVEIAYRNITIDPDTLRVRVGTTVHWTNFDSVEHDVKSVSGPQGFATSKFGQGATVTVKLTHAGTIHYECTIHPATMNGTIEVLR
jgi:plastocyanin